jgi:broad-specificity NMP kinase
MMRKGPPLPVLWLCGGAGTGKSTVAWQVFNDLSAQGLHVGYLDIDQIAMLYPLSDGDAAGHHFKVDNFASVVANYRALGAQAVVVSGVIDPERGGDFAERAVDAAIIFCLLTVEHTTVRDRLAARGWPGDDVDESMQMMSGLLEAPFVSNIVDTDHRTPASLAREVSALIAPVPSTPVRQQLSPCGAGEVTVIVGPRAVGKSSVSWAAAMGHWSVRERTTYADLDQVGFFRPHRADLALSAANLGVIWRNSLARGVPRLIANGMVTTAEDIELLRHAVRPAHVRVIRLAADATTLQQRIQARFDGSPARLINDDLLNASTRVQRAVHRLAVAQGLTMAENNIGDHVIDTTELSIEEAAELAH